MCRVHCFLCLNYSLHKMSTFFTIRMNAYDHFLIIYRHYNFYKSSKWGHNHATSSLMVFIGAHSHHSQYEIMKLSLRGKCLKQGQTSIVHYQEIKYQQVTLKEVQLGWSKKNVTLPKRLNCREKCCEVMWQNTGYQIKLILFSANLKQIFGKVTASTFLTILLTFIEPQTKLNTVYFCLIKLETVKESKEGCSTLDYR